MNYVKHSKMSDVSSFITHLNHIAILTKDNNLYLNNNLIGKSDGHFFFLENSFYSSQGEGTRCESLTNQEVIFSDIQLQKESLRHNTFVKGLDFKREEDYYYSAKLAVYQFEPHKFLYELPKRYIFSRSLRNTDFLYCQYGNTLKSLSLKTGEYLWEANLNKYSTEREVVGIREFLGIWDNKLIVQMDDSDTIVIIDLETGEIAGEIQHIKSYFPKEGPWGFGWYYHLEGQCAYLLQQNRYLRLDLATQKVETLWIPENANFNIQRVSYDEQYSYFMACDGYHVQTDILGVFDRKALKIVWQYDKPIGSSKPPQSDGNKLYCLDNEGTLHIFEKEKNE
jgi:hypothetical protein